MSSRFGYSLGVQADEQLRDSLIAYSSITPTSGGGGGSSITEHTSQPATFVHADHDLQISVNNTTPDQISIGHANEFKQIVISKESTIDAVPSNHNKKNLHTNTTIPEVTISDGSKSHTISHRYATKPSKQAHHNGRLIHQESDDKIYVANNSLSWSMVPTVTTNEATLPTHQNQHIGRFHSLSDNKTYFGAHDSWVDISGGGSDVITHATTKPTYVPAIHNDKIHLEGTNPDQIAVGHDGGYKPLVVRTESTSNPVASANRSGNIHHRTDIRDLSISDGTRDHLLSHRFATKPLIEPHHRGSILHDESDNMIYTSTFQGWHQLTLIKVGQVSLPGFIQNQHQGRFHVLNDGTTYLGTDTSWKQLGIGNTLNLPPVADPGINDTLYNLTGGGLSWQKNGIRGQIPHTKFATGVPPTWTSNFKGTFHHDSSSNMLYFGGDSDWEELTNTVPNYVTLPAIATPAPTKVLYNDSTRGLCWKDATGLIGDIPYIEYTGFDPGAWVSADQGRIHFNNSSDKLYFGGDSSWVSIHSGDYITLPSISIPSANNVLFQGPENLAWKDNTGSTNPVTYCKYSTDQNPPTYASTDKGKLWMRGDTDKLWFGMADGWLDLTADIVFPTSINLPPIAEPSPASSLYQATNNQLTFKASDGAVYPISTNLHDAFAPPTWNNKYVGTFHYNSALEELSYGTNDSWQQISGFIGHTLSPVSTPASVTNMLYHNANTGIHFQDKPLTGFGKGTSVPAHNNLMTGDLFYDTANDEIHLNKGDGWQRFWSNSFVEIPTIATPSSTAGKLYRSANQGLNFGDLEVTLLRSGTVIPGLPSFGEIFHKTDDDTFYIGDSSDWREIWTPAPLIPPSTISSTSNRLWNDSGTLKYDTVPVINNTLVNPFLPTFDAAVHMGKLAFNTVTKKAYMGGTWSWFEIGQEEELLPEFKIDFSDPATYTKTGNDFTAINNIGTEGSALVINGSTTTNYNDTVFPGHSVLRSNGSCYLTFDNSGYNIMSNGSGSKWTVICVLGIYNFSSNAYLIGWRLWPGGVMLNYNSVSDGRGFWFNPKSNLNDDYYLLGLRPNVKKVLTIEYDGNTMKMYDEETVLHTFTSDTGETFDPSTITIMRRPESNVAASDAYIIAEMQIWKDKTVSDIGHTALVAGLKTKWGV